jgi:glucose-1-phosphate thymidylyltransferase
LRRIKEMNGVISHGSAGTKLKPLAHTGPKQILSVANKPISQYVSEALLGSGIEEIAIISGETSED